jgi:hypothetical protein
MGPLFRLVLKPGTAVAVYYWVLTFITVFVGDANLDRFQRWLWSTPQEQQQIPQLSPASEEVEALFGLFRQYMDTQHEMNALRSQMLTLPALPNEGY